MEMFPGIDKIRNDLVYRSITRRDSWENLASGFMDKSGVRLDPYEWRLNKYALSYVVKGGGFFVDEVDRRHPVFAGDFYQRLPGRKHQVVVDPDSGWRECFLSVSENMYSSFTEMRVIKPEPIVCRVGIDNELILKVWSVKERLKAARELELPLMLLEILSLITQFHLFHGTLPESRGETELINAACDYLGKNFRENNDLKSFCLAKGVGYEGFRKLFQKRMGISPGQYRIRKRLDQARQMLATRTFSLGEIADELGFSSQFEFSSQFKKYMGSPPSRYDK